MTPEVDVRIMKVIRENRLKNDLAPDMSDV
jgi:hypothetical protein